MPRKIFKYLWGLLNNERGDAGISMGRPSRHGGIETEAELEASAQRRIAIIKAWKKLERVLEESSFGIQTQTKEGKFE